MPTIADLRAVAATIDSPEGEHEALIMRAHQVTLRHDDAEGLGPALRWHSWPDASVSECVAAVRVALRALEAAE